MHSARFRSSWTSLRLSSSAAFSFHLVLRQGLIMLSPAFASTGTSPRLKILAPASPFSVTAPFSQTSQAPSRIPTQVFRSPRETEESFPPVSRPYVGIGIRVLKMRTDLKRHKPKRVERAWLNNRHVLGGFDRRPGDVGAGAAADIRRAASSLLTNRVQQIEILQRLHKRNVLPPPMKIASVCSIALCGSDTA